jgi:molybdenum cofactor cytidylyltransferase
MGRPKVLLPWRGRPLIAHVLAALGEAPLAPCVVVTGPDTPPLDALGTRVQTVLHQEAATGVGGSLAAGVRAVMGKVDAVLVCLADEPGVPAMAMLRVAALAGRGRTARAVYRGQPGHPVLFPARCFPELLALSGDTGGRLVLQRHPPIAVPIDLPLPLDVDCEADYRRLLLEADSPGPRGGKLAGPAVQRAGRLAPWPESEVPRHDRRRTERAPQGGLG